jgi:hypothetical protein
MLTQCKNQNENVANFKKDWRFLVDHSIIVEFVHDMLLDDEIKLYDEK